MCSTLVNNRGHPDCAGVIVSSFLHLDATRARTLSCLSPFPPYGSPASHPTASLSPFLVQHLLHSHPTACPPPRPSYPGPTRVNLVFRRKFRSVSSSSDRLVRNRVFLETTISRVGRTTHPARYAPLPDEDVWVRSLDLCGRWDKESEMPAPVRTPPFPAEDSPLRMRP